LILISLETLFEIFVPGIQQAYHTYRALTIKRRPVCLQHPMNAGRIPKNRISEQVISDRQKWEDEG